MISSPRSKAAGVFLFAVPLAVIYMPLLMMARGLAHAATSRRAEGNPRSVRTGTRQTIRPSLTTSLVGVLDAARILDVRGTITQHAGRLYRLCDGKREVRIYDYADLEAPMLARMFDRRCRGYEALGYTIVLPANAIAGWPQDVALPAEPAWKRDYAGSVRRLARDSVDQSVASLFVHVARPFDAGAEGTDRARSATEAFLFRRLETLPQTRGRFRLNAVLPIAFDGLGQLEVDLLCDDDSDTTLTPVWPLNSMVTSISPIRSRTVETGAKTCSCRRTATWYCAFSRTGYRQGSGACA